MNVTRLAILGVALFAGAAAFFLMMGEQSVEQGPIQIVQPMKEKTVGVLVVKDNVSRGQRLTADMMTWIAWPEKAAVQAGSYITDTTDGDPIAALEGAVVRTQIIKGEPVTETKIVRAGSSGLMAAVLSPGMRAVNMSVTAETAAGGFILPGDRVDIIYSQMEDGDFAKTRSLLENVRVLAIDANYAEHSEANHLLASNITFELTPDDAQYFLSALNSNGRLSLTLRSVFEAKDQVASGRRNAEVEIIRYGQL